MARGNLLQGTAHGSVGDVVYKRIAGLQVESVRVRSVANPRSNKQLYARALHATCTAAYREGRCIIDHSYEGLSVGHQCMEQFYRDNLPMLRFALADDLINRPSSQFNACLMAQGTQTCVPNTYYVSRGSLHQDFFRISSVSETSRFAVISTPSAVAGTKVTQYMRDNNLQPGDIFTWLMYAVSDGPTCQWYIPGDNDPGSRQKDGQFAFLRMIAKEPSNTSLLVEDAMMTDVFDIVDLGNISEESYIYINPLLFSEQVRSAFFFNDSYYDPCSFACIKSREDSGLRSTEKMQWAYWNAKYGLSWKYALYAWQNSNTINIE